MLGVTYRSEESGVNLILKLTPEESVSRGVSFKENGTYYTVATLDDLLIHLIHRHAPYLTVKINDSHSMTIAELYKHAPSTLYDILKHKGGVEYLNRIINELEKQYEIFYHQNQEDNRYSEMCGD